MKCPRCETTGLDERERDGIVVDACSSCRGIWLDRGELEKLIARAARDLEEPARRYDERRPEHAAEHRRYEDREYDRERHRYPRRKKSWLESLGDVFD